MVLLYEFQSLLTIIQLIFLLLLQKKKVFTYYGYLVHTHSYSEQIRENGPSERTQ
jgi:hypothetical protein